MARLPFKVSARAARLIGRENVATSQGAITEIVKNAYDADARACVILFLPRLTGVPNSISEQQFIELERYLKDPENYYLNVGDARVLRSDLTETDLALIENAFTNILDLWVVDNGHGMSARTIEDHWMVIGTDAKELNDTSIGGRALTGAKGIGRFALDRLGKECELISGEASKSSTVIWLVDWGDFEGKGKIIDDVEALLETVSQPLLTAYGQNGLSKYLPIVGPSRDESGAPLDFSHGTAIKISYLHDKWDERDSLKLKQTLEALLPPKDRGDFNIYVYDHRAIEESGWIDNFPPDQFDYRLDAKVLSTGDVSIQLDRQEIDAKKIRSSVFDFKEMQTKGFLLQDFEAGFIKYNTNLKKLLKLKEQEDLDQYLALGPFEFTLYFFKLANPSEDNLKRYPQKSFDVAKRRRWLHNSGGIRLYRDGFRVRPYGEPNTQGSDWLLLGQRVAANPAAAKRLGWRVPPQQLAGTINITKGKNPLLADQSNREGIMNERAFAAFRAVILALITEFENDRSYIFHHFDKAYEIDNAEENEVEEGRQLAEGILTKTDGTQPVPEDGPTTEEHDKLASQNLKIAKAYKSENEKNEALKDDIQVMRGMATLGTVLVSFTHELKQIKANMESRSTRMENALHKVVNKELLKTMPDAANPFRIAERWNREDEKVSRWVDFALSSVSPKKRRRGDINLDDYLQSLNDFWFEFLSSKQINLHIDCVNESPIYLLAHEIDLDSVFYNLIVNSVQVFLVPSTATSRDIWIEISELNKNQIGITYRDNGPGLSNSFNVAEDIFLFGTSSKPTDGSEDVSGTGIGMWLVKSIVDDYNGSIALLSKMGEVNFSLSITLPRHKKVTNAN